MNRFAYLAVTVFFFLFPPSQLAAQTGMTSYRQAKAQEALAEQKYGASLSDAAKKEAAELFAEAGRNYSEASKEVRGLKYFASFAAYKAYTQSAEAYLEVSDYENAMAIADSALKIWPRPFNIPVESVIEPKNIREAGAVYMLQAETDQETWYRTYYRGRAAAAEAAYSNGKMAVAQKLAEDVIGARNIASVTWKSHYILSDINYQAQQICVASDYAITALEQSSTTQPAPDTGAIKACNICVDKLIYILEQANEKQCLDKMELKRIAIALSNYNTRWEPFNDEALKFGEMAFEKAERSKELSIAMVRAAEGIGNTEKKNLWLDRLEKTRKKVSSEEWYKASNLYAELGQTKKQIEAAKKGHRKWVWENTHFAISTNPWMLYKQQYNGALDVMLPRTSHQFMFNYIKNQRHYFIPPSFDNFEFADTYMPFQGMQAEYALKFLFPKKDEKDYYSYIGPQLRYTKRDYATTDTLQITPDDPDLNVFYSPVNASGKAYDLTVVFGQMQRIKWMFFDVYAGFGIGYKSIETDIPGGLKENKVEDYKLRSEIWDKTYIPLRAGFRVGVVLK